MASRDFFIVRVGDITDPAAPLEFYPPKGSDELHDALKKAYPNLSNLQSRMREAVIEFYMNEQAAERELPSQFALDVMDNDFFPSPDSSFGTGAAPTISTPNTGDDSASTSGQLSTSSGPSQQDLMNVWTLPTSTQTKIYKRRNMTAEEKVKYRAKRLTGACDDCRRRRRKCHHDLLSSTQQISAVAESRSTREKASRSTADPKASTKPARAKTTITSAVHGSQLEDDMFCDPNGLVIGGSVSMDMFSNDSTLPYIDPFFNDPTFNLPFDLDHDFELSPFLDQEDRNLFDHRLGTLGPAYLDSAAPIPNPQPSLPRLQMNWSHTSAAASSAGFQFCRIPAAESQASISSTSPSDAPVHGILGLTVHDLSIMRTPSGIPSRTDGFLELDALQYAPSPDSLSRHQLPDGWNELSLQQSGVGIALQRESDGRQSAQPNVCGHSRSSISSTCVSCRSTFACQKDLQRHITTIHNQQRMPEPSNATANPILPPNSSALYRRSTQSTRALHDKPVEHRTAKTRLASAAECSYGPAHPSSSQMAANGASAAASATIVQMAQMFICAASIALLLLALARASPRFVSTAAITILIYTQEPGSSYYGRIGRWERGKDVIASSLGKPSWAMHESRT